MGLQPIFGLWADHGHRRKLVVLGCSMTCLIMLLGPISRYPNFMNHWSGYLTMLIILLVAKTGVGMFHPPAVSLAGNTSSVRRSTVVSLFIAFGMIGMGLSQIMFSTVFIGLNGYTEILMIPGLCIVVWVAVWCHEPAEKLTGPLGLGAMFAKLRHLPGRLISLWAVQVFMSISFVGLIFLLPEFVEKRGMSRFWVNGGALMVWMAGAVLIMVPVGHLADRFGRRRMLCLCLALATASYYAMAQITPMPTALLLLLLFVTGGAIGASNPISISLGQHLLPENQSLITGVLMGLAWSLASVSSWLAGYMVDTLKMSFTTTISWLGIGLIVALVLVLLTPGLGRDATGDVRD
jgi:FSR family fosmidomycin resistance protein-like MFS transporter